MAEDSRAFDAEVARALEAVGAGAADPALDGLADPAGAARALAELEGGSGGAQLLRAAPEIGEGGEDGFGPTPTDPIWVRIEAGSTQVKLAPLRLAAGGRAEGREAARVVVTSRRRPCCDSAGCTQERTHAEAWLALEGEGLGGRRLLVAEARDLDGERAEALVAAVAAPLAGALGVALEAPAGAGGRPGAPGVEAGEPLLPAAALARFALRAEGDPAVLRDHASAGPRASAARNTGIGVALIAAAVALWIQVARSLSAGDRGAAVGVGAAAALLSLAGYTFLGVARFASAYVARSSPVAWLSRDRFVVAPWVSRAGAIGLRPEGRFGAAIAVGELRAVSAHPRGDRWVVELDTEHGPFDVLRTGDEAVARYWRAAFERTAAAVRHPGGPSARQRLRARAQGQPL